MGKKVNFAFFFRLNLYHIGVLQKEFFFSRWDEWLMGDSLMVDTMENAAFAERDNADTNSKWAFFVIFLLSFIK